MNDEVNNILSKYMSITRLEGGLSSQVYKCDNTLVKIVCDNPIFAMNEIRILEKLSQNNVRGIPRLYSHKKLSDGSYCMIQEYVADTDLVKFITTSRCSSRLLLDIFIQITSIMKQLHELGIVHNDIKLDNIMINKSHEIFLIDFGYSCSIHQEDDIIGCSSIYAGTLYYISPEKVAGNDYDKIKAEIYSLGITFYACMTKLLPSQATEYTSLVHETHVPLLEKGDPDLCDLIHYMLSSNPSKRPSIQSISTALASIRAQYY